MYHNQHRWYKWVKKGTVCDNKECNKSSVGFWLANRKARKVFLAGKLRREYEDLFETFEAKSFREPFPIYLLVKTAKNGRKHAQK
jgi:hypothetical protein